MPCSDQHFVPILDEIRAREEACPEPRKASPAKRNWGGRRRGAGAPKGNLNALKRGRYSSYQKAVIDAMMEIPELRDTLVALGKRKRAQQRRAEKGAAALMTELFRRTAEIALYPENNHLEDIQDFLASIRSAEGQLEKILERQSS